MTEFFGFSDEPSIRKVKKATNLFLGMRSEYVLPRGPKSDSNSASASSNTGSGTCGCCNPSNCDDYPVAIDGCDACIEAPRAWRVNFGSMASALCDAWTSPKTLSHSGYCVWRSSTFLCNELAATGGCTGLAVDCNCAGSSIWGESGGAWVATAEDCAGSDCTVPGPPNCDPVVGETLELPCTTAEYAVYTSDLAGEDTDWYILTNPCDSVPPAPSIQAFCEGHEVRVSCCTPVDPDAGELTYSYLELTLSDQRDAENRNETVLTLVIGDVDAITWQMPIGKDWCCTCENKMELKCCGPYAFSGVPETICVVPDEATGGRVSVPENWSCCTPPEDNGSPYLPEAVYFNIDQIGNPLVDPSDVGDCCQYAVGTFVLEWNGTDGWEYLFFEEPISEAAAVALSCGTPEPADIPCIEPLINHVVYKWKLYCQDGFGFMNLALYRCHACYSLQSGDLGCESLVGVLPGIITWETNSGSTCFVDTEIDSFSGVNSVCDPTPTTQPIIIRALA